MTTVKQLVSAAFGLAFMQPHHQKTRETWINISHRIGGGLLPNSLLVVSIQHMGRKLPLICDM